MSSFVQILLLFSAVIGYVSCQQARIDQDYGEIAKYQFAYSVDDPETGDKHAQEEQRDGDVVNGYYIVIQPDGVERRVEYTADEEHGFQAKVTYQAGQGRVVAPVVKPQPVVRPVQVVSVPVQVVRQQPIVRTVVKKRPVQPAPVRVQTVQTVPVQTYQTYQSVPVQTYQSVPVQTLQSVPVTYSSNSPVQVLHDSHFAGDQGIYTYPQSQVYSVGQTILKRR